MFFFVGGVQPKTIVLDDTPRLCPSCGLARARLVRIDHYLSLFFIPLVRLKKGEPVMMCEGCGFTGAESPRKGYPAPSGVPLCQSCHKPVDPAFRYCPHCGSKL